MPGKKQFYVDKNLITIPPLLNTLIIAVVAPGQMFFLWSSLAHLLASGKSHFAYRKHFLLWFSWGRLVDILSHSPLVCHFILDVVFCCLLRYDLKLKVSDWPLNITILFVLLSYTKLHYKRAGVHQGPIRLLDLTYNLHLSTVGDTWAMMTNKDWSIVFRSKYPSKKIISLG